MTTMHEARELYPILKICVINLNFRFNKPQASSNHFNSSLSLHQSHMITYISFIKSMN